MLTQATLGSLHHFEMGWPEILCWRFGASPGHRLGNQMIALPIQVACAGESSAPIHVYHINFSWFLYIYIGTFVWCWSFSYIQHVISIVWPLIVMYRGFISGKLAVYRDLQVLIEVIYKIYHCKIISRIDKTNLYIVMYEITTEIFHLFTHIWKKFDGKPKDYYVFLWNSLFVSCYEC